MSGHLRAAWVRGLAVVVGLGGMLASVAAADPTPSKPQLDFLKADTSQATRQSAIQSIPIDQLAPDGRAKVAWVLAHTSVFRRLPVRVVPCDPELYLFLVQHPDVVVNIWEVLGITHLWMRQTGPDSYQVRDEAGTSGTLEYLYRSRDTQVAYVEGLYTGKLFGHHVRGRGIVVLKSGYVRDTQGRCFVSSRLDAFMHIEPDGAEFLTKTFQPLVGKVADLNFVQTADFLASLSRTAEVNRRGMQRLVSRLEGVQPEVRQQFGQLAERVAERASRTGPLLGHEPLPNTSPSPDSSAPALLAQGTNSPTQNHSDKLGRIGNLPADNPAETGFGTGSKTRDPGSDLPDPGVLSPPPSSGKRSP